MSSSKTINTEKINNSAPSITLHQRMISACVGSVLTSLFLTPMDVVRVRVQQQGMLPSCDCPPVPATTVSTWPSKTALSSVNTQQIFKKKSVVFWEDQCFKDLNCSNSPMKNFDGMLDAFRKIAKYEGVSTLWRGLSLTLLMAIPSNVVYYSGYEALRDLSQMNELSPTLNSVACGGFARVIAASTISPLELLKTRLQSIPASSNSFTILKDLLAETKQEVSKSGIRALYKGLEVTLWRDVPFSGIYWGSYEFYKKNLWLDYASSSYFVSASESSNLNHFINSFLGGSVSGSIAGLVTHPFDVAKTRRQISIMNDEPHITSSSSTSITSNKNMFKYINNIWKVEGFGALYAGLLPRIIKIAPSCAIMISTYEVSKKFFTQE